MVFGDVKDLVGFENNPPPGLKAFHLGECCDNLPRFTHANNHRFIKKPVYGLQ